MLKWPRTIRSQFFVLIGIGTLVGIFVPAGWYVGVCRSQVHHVERDTETNNQKPSSKQDSQAITFAQYGQASARARRSESESEQPPIFCEARFTDVFLVFFTYCLVVVGWATMKNSDQTLREVERARLFIGPSMPHIRILDMKTIIPIAISNQGKTAGILKEMAFDWATREPDGRVAGYIAPTVRKLDMAIPPNFLPSVPMDTFESGCATAHYIFGYAVFQDVFGRWHETRFCNKIDPVARTLELAGQPENQQEQH